MDREYAKYLLKETCQNYNRIALHFTRSRGFVWDIDCLKEYVVPEERVLDLGCGNGRLYKIFKDKKIDYVGVDNSGELIEIAKENYPHLHFQTADALNLPFPDNHFDKIYSIRALHNLPSQEFRTQFLAEANRVLKPGGTLILTVWNVWECRDKQNLFRLIKSTFLKIIGASKLDFGDTFIPWGDKASRYYHFFTKNELKSLTEKADFEVAKIWTTGKEWKYSDIYIVAHKPAPVV
ncbi:class I SAM-dependent methyltransferase [Candidatus Parcubacteria bacterium]|nr:class I SAM-dependent methyltransferase [Candidatus Parcubacteria bacterium]